MKITIAHLFHDLLNLYGESGNILALENALKQQNIAVEIKYLSLDNNSWDLENVDFIYIGAGTEQNQMLVLNKLKEHSNEIKQHILNGKHILATGNAIELFGRFIKDTDKEIEALGLFNYTTERTSKRIVSECLFYNDETASKIIGFENHQGIIHEILNPLFSVEKGFGSEISSKVEGIKQDNFYGTYLIGPLLVRNPKFLEKICKDIILHKDINFKFAPFDFEIEQTAHDKFLNKYNKD